MTTTINQFAVGQSVYFSPGYYANAASSGVFTVTRVMPRDEAGWHYHIQSSHDRHVRRAHEDQLKPLKNS
jgi:hypothetical protein